MAFQVDKPFEQTLRVGLADGSAGHLGAYLTIRGHLTDVPLGEGQIDPTTGSVVLSPQMNEQGPACGFSLRDACPQVVLGALLVST